MELLSERKLLLCSTLISLSLLVLLSTSSALKIILYKGTGDTLIGFTEEQAIPYVLKSEDLEMGCMMSEAFSLFIQSFSRVTHPPNHLAILFNLMAGNCSEFKASEEELRYLRAIYSKNSHAAQDARIAQQRFLFQAARRQLAGYDSLVSAFVEPGGECPDFKSDHREFFWLIGLVDGLQAFINDMTSGRRVGVPLDIGLKVGRGAACLNNDKWWGMPNAIQATVWCIFPSLNPVGKDPFKILDQSMQTGLQQGVRVPQLLAAQIYIGLGNIEKVKEIVRRHVGAKVQTPANPEFRILDEMTTHQLMAISDRLWTQATGSRTPIGGLGTFWDDPKQTVDAIEIIDIL